MSISQVRRELRLLQEKLVLTEAKVRSDEHTNQDLVAFNHGMSKEVGEYRGLCESMQKDLTLAREVQGLLGSREAAVL